MFKFPPLPPVEGLHPLLVHLPLGVLAVVPVFILIAGLWASRRREFILAALVLVTIGTIGTMAAAWSGEAAEHVVPKDPGLRAAVHHHEELAETARNLFFVATVGLAAATVTAWHYHGRLRRPIALAGTVVLLALYTLPLLALANAGHAGAVLVHGLGIRAPLEAADLPPR